MKFYKIVYTFETSYNCDTQKALLLRGEQGEWRTGNDASADGNRYKREKFVQTLIGNCTRSALWNLFWEFPI